MQLHGESFRERLGLREALRRALAGGRRDLLSGLDATGHGGLWLEWRLPSADGDGLRPETAAQESALFGDLRWGERPFEGEYGRLGP